MLRYRWRDARVGEPILEGDRPVERHRRYLRDGSWSMVTACRSGPCDCGIRCSCAALVLLTMVAPRSSRGLRLMMPLPVTCCESDRECYYY